MAPVEGTTLLAWSRQTVGQWLRTHPQHRAERDDLVSYACEQALRAAPRYDPTRGASPRRTLLRPGHADASTPQEHPHADHPR